MLRWERGQTGSRYYSSWIFDILSAFVLTAIPSRLRIHLADPAPSRVKYFYCNGSTPIRPARISVSICFSKRRNGREINSLYYRTEERQETEWMSDESAFVGGKRVRTYGALFRRRPRGPRMLRCEKERERNIPYPTRFQIVSHIAPRTTIVAGPRGERKRP